MGFFGRSWFVVLLFGAGDPVPAPLKVGVESINKDAVQAHVRYMADEARAGRDSGQPGMFEAAQYIAERFAKAGLEPGGDRGTFLRAFDLPGYKATTKC